MSPAGDMIRTSGPPLLSASVPGDTESWFSTSSDHPITSSLDTRIPGTMAKTEPSSAFALSRTLNDAETSTQRVRSTASPLVHSSPPAEGTESEASAAATTMDLSEGARGGTTRPMGDSTSLETGISSGPVESVATTTRELSQGEPRGTTWPTSNPTSLMIAISLGMPTRSPEMATAFQIVSSKEPGTSPEARHALGNSWETSTATVPTETTVEAVSLQATATGRGSISLPRLPTGSMAPATSPTKGTATTGSVSLPPSKAWTSPLLGTPEGTLESAPKGTTGTGPQSSPTPIPKPTGVNFSTWFGSAAGTRVDTHVSLNTSSPGLENSVAIPDSVTIQKVTMSSETDKSELIAKTNISATAIPPTVLSEKTVTGEQQASISVGEAYSSASPRSEQTTESDLTIGKSPEATDILDTTSIEQTTLASLTSESEATASLTSVSGGKMSSSPSVTFPSVGPKMPVAVASVVTSDVASTLGLLSRTSSPAGGSIMDVTTAPSPGVTTTITTMETNSVLTTMPNAKGSVSATDSALATMTSASALEHPHTWSSTATPAPASGSWTTTDMASILGVTSSPKTISAVGTTSSLASSSELGSVSTFHGLATVGTSLASTSSYASGEETEASTSVRALSPLDTTSSLPIPTSGVERTSTSVPDILSTSWTPSRRETEALHVSVAPTDNPNTKTLPKVLPPTPLPGSLSTLDWATGNSVSPLITATSAPQGVTTPPELPLEKTVSLPTSQLPSSVGDITSGLTPATMVTHSKVSLSGRLDPASTEAVQSSTQLPTTAAADPGHVSRPEATTLDLTPYTVRTPDPTPQGNGLRTPTAEARAASHSWMGKEEPNSGTSLSTEVMPVSLSGGTIKEVTDSPGFLRTTDLWRVSLEAETTSSPSWKKSTRERIATSEPATGREATRPATDTIDTTVWSTDSARDLHSSVAAHSEPSMGTSPKNTTSITVKAAVPTVTTTGPESTRAGTELDHPLTTGLGESSTYTDTNSTTEMSTVHSPGSVVITRGSRTEGTTSDRISIAALAQSTASSDMARPSTLPAMGGSERMTITMQNGPSGTTPRAAPTLEKSATASLSGTHLAVTQGFPQSSVVTSSTNRDITVSTSLTNSSNTVTIQTDSTSSLVPELRETSTIQRNSSATDKITVLSKEPTAALTEVSRTEPTSSSSMPTPGPVQSAVSPDTTAGIITRPSASSVRTASEEMTITTQTGTPGATSQGTLSLDTSTKASVVVTQSLTQSPLTTLMSRGPSSVEATSSPSSPAPLPAGRSPSSESSTFPGRSPSSPTPATSILTHSLAKTTDMVSTSLEPGTSSPSSQISTNIEMLSTSEAPTGTGALRPSENTAVTNGISTSSGRETHSSAPADSEPPRASSPALASSTSSDTSVSTSIPPSSVTTTIETDSTSSLNPELRDTSTIQQNSSATQDVTVFSKVPTGTTTEVSSSMSIPGTFQSTMSPDTPAGIITKPSAASVRTTSAEMTITTQTGPPGAASQGTRTLDALPKASVAGTHSAVTQSLTQSPLTTLMSRGPSSGEATSSPSSPVPLPAGTSPAPESSTLPGRSPASPSPGTSHHTPGLVKTTEPFGTISEPAATLPPTLSSTKAEMLFTSEFSIGSAKVFPSIYTTVTTAGSSSSGHDRSSSVPVFSKSSSPSYPVGTASTLGETTFSTSMHSSFETTGFDTKTLSRLTPGLNETSTALASGSETLTSTPSSPVSTHVWRSPETDATSPVKLSVPDQPLPSQDTQIPVETVTRFYGSPSVAGSAGTAVPTSHLSVSVTESTHHASTDTLSSAETILADALTSSPSEAVASFATSGVAGAISATLSASPFSRTESGPKGAALSTMAETLLSSTASPSSILSTSDASTSPLPRWLTSTPAATRTADSSLKAESSTARGPLVMVSTLKTWTQPFRTSLSPMADTRMTESVGLGPVTSSQVLPHSTRLTSKDPRSYNLIIWAS
uniref:Mucin-16 n=1 Tax=Camelus bactrianus TaxID=9837 RepID=A0A9W3G475_CAMBA|nr:mucin-16 [Camelus bactrianus]